MRNCSFESLCATWLQQAGWQVFLPLLDHGHKTDLLVSDGPKYYHVQVKTLESQDEHVEVENRWKGSHVQYVVFFARNSNWGYIIPAFGTNRKKLDCAGGQRFQQSRDSFLKAFHALDAEPNKAPEPTPGSVTPRAVESKIEMKQPKENRSVARGAPAPVVAHL
jgi:hypothetical protein